MPLTPQQKNAQSYNAIKNGLYNLNKFISANGSDDLFSLFTENKKTEIDNLFFIPPRQSKPGTSHKGKVVDLLTITNGWFLASNKGDPKNEIRENIFKLFSFDEKKTRELRQELTKNKQHTEQAIINQLETFEAKIGNLTTEQTFIYINLYISVRWDNILSLVRLKEIQNSLSAKKFTSLSPENYEFLKNKKTTENLASQDTSHDLSFSQLGHIKDWPKVKNGILNDLVPPQTDSLSSDSIPSSSNTEINPSTSANYNANPVENSSASTDTSVSIAPSIDIPIVIIESAKNQEIAQLKHTKKELEEKSQSLEAIKANLETQISELQILLQNKEDVLHRESESKRQQLEKLETTITGLRENIKDKDAKLQSLKEIEQKEFLELQSAKLQLQKILNSEDKLNLELKATKTILATAQTQIEEKAQTNANLNIEIKEKNTKLKELSTNLEKELAVNNDLILKREVLTKERDALQKTLQNQDELYKNLQSKDVDNATKIIEMNSEISRTNSILTDTQTELNAVTKKYDESKETIDNLQLNKIELEKQKNNLIVDKEGLQVQLSQLRTEHQTFSKNYEELNAELGIKQKSLIRAQEQLEEETKQSEELRQEIERKNKQTETLQNEIQITNKNFKGKQSEFQQATDQVSILTQQLQIVKAAEKTATGELDLNKLKIQKLGEEIQNLERFKTENQQIKDKNTDLSRNLNLEKDGREKLQQQLRELINGIHEFCQTMENDLEKLNPSQTIMQEGQNPIEAIISEEAQKVLSSFIQQPLTAIVDNDEQNDIPSNDPIGRLNLLKLKTISSRSMLINRSLTNGQHFSVNQEKMIEELQNELKKSAENINKLKNDIKKLTQSRDDFGIDSDDDDDFGGPFYYDSYNLPVRRVSSNSIDNEPEINPDQYLHNIFNKFPEFQKIQLELQQKIDEITQLKDQLKSQETLEVEMDALKRSFGEAAETLSVLKSEKGGLNKDLNDAQEILRSSKFEIAGLQVELEKLQKNDSSNQEQISKLTNQIGNLKQLCLDKDESIQELTKKIEINANLIKGKEEQIESLNKTLTETQGKSGQLENRNGQLEEQTIKIQKNIDQLTNGEIALSSQIEELTIEKENLNQKLKDAQEALQTSKSEINNLQVEIEKQQTNKSTDKEQISKLTKQLDELNKPKSQQEKLISELQSRLISKNAELKELFDQHSVNDELVAKLHYTISTYENKLFETDKEIETLKEKLETSQKDDSNLRDNYASLDKKLSEKNSELNTIESELNESKKQLEEAKAKIESLNKKLDKINAAKQSLQEELDNFKKEQDAMKDGISLRPNNPMDQDSVFDLNTQNLKRPHSLVNSSAAQSGHSNTSSGHSSRSSSSSSPSFNPEEVDNSSDLFPHGQSSSLDEAFSEGSNGSVNDPGSQSEIPVFAPSTLRQTHSVPDLMRFNSDDSLDSSLPLTETTESPTVPITNPTNTGASMPRQKQQDTQVDNTSSIHERGVINAFKKENHEEIRLAFTAEFSRVATAAANLLFNENIVANADLPTFKNELDEKASEEIKRLIFALSNKKELLSEFIEKIHTEGLNASTYLEEVKNSASFIFGTLKIKRQGEADQTYKDYIKDIGENLLIKLCTENLQTEGDNLLQIAKQKLKSKIITNNLQPIEQHTETIKIAAEELVTNILKVDKLKNIIEDAKNDPIAGVNLLEASKQKLQEQLEQEVDQTFDHYFPIVHLNPIFQKIKDGEVLSEEEIQKIPFELQYADTPEEFALGLCAHYSHLKSLSISRDIFRKTLLILRKNALSAINPTLINNNELVDLSAEAWLEKKLQLLTDKSIDLKLDHKQQTDLDNKFHSLFPLSPLEDMAVTYKSVGELTDELEKLHGLKVNATDRLYKIFAEIENKLKEYPNLIKDISLFKEYLNIQLTHAFPENKIKWSVNSNKWKVNENETKIILAGINRRLGDDISKWNLFNHANDKLAEEIARDISTYPIFINSNFELVDIKKLVTNALRVLYKFPNLKDILNKREQWKTEIQQLYAFAEKLRSFRGNKEIEDRKATLEAMQDLKQIDINNNLNLTNTEIPSAVYLPHSCRTIPNTDESYSSSYNVIIEGNAFYKQNALKIGETITFEQTLSNDEKRNWSVTRIDDKCLAYKTHKPWKDIGNNIKDRFRCETSYVREISFAQMIHSVNSFKNAKICTLNFGNCSTDMKRKLYLFAHAYNELRHENNDLLKGPRILCHMKNPPDMDKAKIVAIKNEIKAKLNLRGEELADISEKLKDDTISHKTIRSRG